MFQMPVTMRSANAAQATRPNDRAGARGTSAPAPRSTGRMATSVIWPPTQTVAARTWRNSRTVSAVTGSMRAIVRDMARIALRWSRDAAARRDLLPHLHRHARDDGLRPRRRGHAFTWSLRRRREADQAVLGDPAHRRGPCGVHPVVHLRRHHRRARLSARRAPRGPRLPVAHL